MGIENKAEDGAKDEAAGDEKAKAVRSKRPPKKTARQASLDADRVLVEAERALAVAKVELAEMKMDLAWTEATRARSRARDPMKKAAQAKAEAARAKADAAEAKGGDGLVDWIFGTRVVPAVSEAEVERVTAEVEMALAGGDAEAGRALPEAPCVPKIRIVEPSAVMRAKTAAASLEKEAGQRVLKMIRDCFDAPGSYDRLLATAPHPSALAGLDAEFPLFRDVTRSVSEQVGLSWSLSQTLGKPQPVKIRNVMLVGKPGYGKTTYLRALALALGTPFRSVPMGSATAGFIISGGDSTWQGSKPGLIHDLLARGTTGNPLILLDELDKVGGDPRHRPDGALYALLEPETAAEFVDEFAGYALDASAISWCASANSLDTMPDAIVSRFEIFEVPEPDEEQARATAVAVYLKARIDAPWGALFDEAPSDAAIEALSEVSPREAVRLLGTAFGRACARGSSTLAFEDFPRPRGRAARVGFV